MTQTPIWQQLMSLIFRDNPYAGFDPSPYPLDLQGWGSQHPNFANVIDEVQPRLIIEVGTWKGGSAIHMAKLMQQRNWPCAILCVDTWLGAMEFWERKDQQNWFPSLRLSNGYPQVYYQFLANVVHSGLQDCILPFPTTSSIAARFFAKYKIQPDMLYLDASHDEIDVYLDLVQLWPSVRPGGILFGDDFTDAWPGLRNAVQNFARQIGMQVEIRDRQWMFRKPASMMAQAA
ncbi:MAG TPA: class I SAM-dependent methyltransferase [Tepidisphaeraceae bacterium]|nr:class I SAM-dependent methyltransferase [Tepidisphaeraceae bacterium]